MARRQGQHHIFGEIKFIGLAVTETIASDLRFADHHSGFGPRTRIAHSRNARHDLHVIGAPLVSIMKLVMFTPDVEARSTHGIAVSGLTEVSGGAYCADVLILPARCTTASRAGRGHFGYIRWRGGAGVVHG